jgi:hypothetical protein
VHFWGVWGNGVAGDDHGERVPLGNALPPNERERAL